MRNFKKFLTLVLAVMMVVSAMSFTTSAATTKFEDVDAENEALVNAVDLLEYMGITKGVSATEFGADQAVTREQFALFMYRLMKGGKDASANASNTTKFTDLEDQTYFYAISWANAKGIVNGTSDTTFSPKNGITLQDAYTMVVRALDYEAEENLIYPHGYIDVAEQLGVELDANLPSDIDYEDTLTRGDMAIILYNAFFAETAIPEVDTKEVLLGASNENENDDTWVLKEITTYPRLCEKNFDVKEVKYQAVATPNYTTLDNEPTYDLGYDAALFEVVADEETDYNEVPALVYLEPEQIGLEGEDLNDYFLGEFTMFVTTDDEEEEIEKVLFADCNMVKKTVNDLVLGTVSSNKAASYYTEYNDEETEDDDEPTETKLLSGKITTGTEVIYAFNAPYTYLKPTYVTGASNYIKYVQRNANNLWEIDFVLQNEDDVDFYEAGAYPVVDFAEEDDGDVVDAYFTEQAEQLVTYFSQVYYGGLYEADLYDVDGDGVYEYIDYKPYSFFQVDSDEDYDFDDSYFNEETALPYIYTNEANVTGAEFADEDFVIGYVDELTNAVKVVEVVKPTVTSVSKIKSNTGSIILADGTPVNAGAWWKLVANYAFAEDFDDVVLEEDFDELTLGLANASDLLNPAILDEEEVELYIYNGVVLYADDVDNNLKFTENLLIPLDLDGNVPEKEFNKETGDRVWYIYAYVDGACKYVPVVTEDVLPEVVADGALTEEYAYQLCTYSVDADGMYTIKALGFDTDDEDETDYKGLAHDIEILDSDDEDDQFIGWEEDVTMVKKAGTRFALEGAATYDRQLVLKSFTKIVILVYDDVEDEWEIEEYDAASFKASAEVAFDYATFVVANNPDSESKEDLVVLFAVVTDEDGFGLETKKDKNGQRIVSLSTPGVDENGYYRNYYEVFNPFTGARELDVAGNETSRTAEGLADAIDSGVLVELKGGMVDEKGYVAEGEDYLGAINTNLDNAGLVWITEYDEADDFITVVPVSATAGVDCDACFEDAIEGYTFDGEVNFDGVPFLTVNDNDQIFFEVNKDTAVSVLRYADVGESTTMWGTMTLGDLSTIADAKKEFKCYSDKVEDSKGNYTTKYAPYLKAYISYSEGEDEDEDLPVADYIIVVVNKVKNADLGMFARESDVHDIEA